ncbi:hypothetical protein C8R46DRAFT_253713 [Mycena filopes]|nr:hypothetical protein C8R46DRAFT_253713 [Mycena filopes]
MQIKPEDERTLRWYRFPISSAHGNPRAWTHKREDVMQLARASNDDPQRKPRIFPISYPRDQQPPLMGVLKDGYPTPLYALAWVRNAGEILRENPDIDLSGICYGLFRPRWRQANYQFPGFLFDPDTIPGEGPEGHVYCTFAYNTQQTMMDLATQSDEFLAAWRDTIQIKPEDEGTLRWYRLPIRWKTHRNPRTWTHDQ